MVCHHLDEWCSLAVSHQSCAASDRSTAFYASPLTAPVSITPQTQGHCLCTQLCMMPNVCFKEGECHCLGCGAHCLTPVLLIGLLLSPACRMAPPTCPLYMTWSSRDCLTHCIDCSLCDDCPQALMMSLLRSDLNTSALSECTLTFDVNMQTGVWDAYQAV